jgi:uroporphyrinogen-III synthase
MSRYVLITRHPSDCTELQSLLDPCGITLRPYPVLRLEDVDDTQGWPAAAAIEPPAWLVLASPRAPQRFVDRCHQHDATHLISLPSAAVGTSTADAAEEAGLGVELIGPGTGRGLADALIDRLQAPTQVIFACGRDRRPELPNALEAAGHTVVPVEVYRMDPTPPRELPPLGPSLDAVVLTSPRSASLYLDGVGGMPLPCRHWALGPTTQQAAAAIGIDCLIPPEPSIKSLAEELCKN